jgi:hypothetical protein
MGCPNHLMPLYANGNLYKSHLCIMHTMAYMGTAIANR